MFKSMSGIPHSKLIKRPGTRLGDYPQQAESKRNDFEQACYQFYQGVKARLSRRFYSQSRLVRQVNVYEQVLKDCSESELNEAIATLREELLIQGLQNKLIVKAFAVIREVSGRISGKRHFDVQLFGGWIMIKGKLAEMETGEGKTLTTTLPACTAALAGIPVHVITANDYLAARDAEILMPLYSRLGISCSSVVEGMDLEQKKAAYQCDIVHTTNKQIAFDYLRDRIEIADEDGPLSFQYRQILRRQQPQLGGQLILRGLCFALIDEADSVLIDEASTPLIITKTIPSETTPEYYADALYLASTLFIDIDYTIDQKDRAIELTVAGEENLSDLMLTMSKFWRNKRRCKMLIKQALAATHLYKKDEQYVVNEDKIQIIDQATGRIMADRSWEQGLHQMIEAKEGCIISEQREPQARISYQKFFSRYLHLSGTSGTISEVAGELQTVYGLDVLKVATNRTPKRKLMAELVFRDEAAKTKALLDRIKQLFDQRRAVLIGTRSVEESENIGELLQGLSIPHRILNAKQDKHEADIIAQAGQAQSITVATNMAGRGTDISLSEEVANLGGLHVIALYRNDSLRIDRQLYGRCARQGDPGSAEAMLSLEDITLVNYYSSTMLKLLLRLAPNNKPLPVFISKLILRKPQSMKERQQSRSRNALMKQDRKLQRILAFAGKFE